MTFRNQNGKVVGKMIDGVFTKSVKYSRHHLHSYKAWAIDKDIVEQLKQFGCKEIIIRDTEKKTKYSILFSYFLENCFGINHGYGEQLAVHDDKFTDNKKRLVGTQEKLF